MSSMTAIHKQHIQSTLVISTSSEPYKKCLEISECWQRYADEFSLCLTLYKCACLTYKSMEDVSSCSIINMCVSVINSLKIVCLIIIKHITIYFKSKMSSNREILVKNRLYLRHCVYCVMEKLLLRKVTASFMLLCGTIKLAHCKYSSLWE